MKSKIVALSKNEDFKTLLKKKKVSNKYEDKIRNVKNEKIKQSLLELTKVFKQK